MAVSLIETADSVMKILSDIPGVESCALYGSITSGTYDSLSDIDIEICVRGTDNGIFVLNIPEMLGKYMHIFYADYAPSLAPAKYIVSLAIDESDPFRMVDICVKGDPHFETVTRQELSAKNDSFCHVLKLWTANLKHHVRGADCRSDIVKMAKRLDVPATDDIDEQAMLAKTLEWLEAACPADLRIFVASCRKHFYDLTS